MLGKASGLITLAVVWALGLTTCTPSTEVPSSDMLLTQQSIESSGRTRTFNAFVPALSHGQKAPIVVVLHGNGQSAKKILGLDNNKAPFKRWLTIAKDKKVLILAPDGVLGSAGSAGWNDCRDDAVTNPMTDDVAFIDALVDLAISQYGGNEARIYATGISNGGNMAIRLAIERPNRFVAVAPVAAALAAQSKCGAPSMCGVPSMSKPVGMLLINGTKDPIRPDGGGAILGTGRGTVCSTAKTITAFRQAANLIVAPVEEDLQDSFAADGSTVTRVGGPPGALVPNVVLLRINEGGHTEPSPTERYSSSAELLKLVGKQNGDFEMADVVWDFFDSQHR